MPSPNDERLLEIAVAIADGRPIDWNANPSGSETSGPASSSLIQRLQALERLVRGHEAIRTNSSPVEDAGDTILTEASRQRLSTEQPLQVHWGPLVIIEKIGRGSFGDVYRAWDPRLDREVALKLIPETASEADATPVVEEGRLLARVRHPNVLTVFGAERIDGRVGIWTELIDGETLAAEVARRGALEPEEAARIGVDVCRALDAVHRAGLLHRDVKAQNILRDSNGHLVLCDFGTGVETSEKAAVTEPQVAGTPLYMAPEVIEHEPPTIASDLYSIGVLLYFLVTGDYPVRGRTLADIRRAHAAGTSIPLRTQRPGVPTRFADVVDALLTRGPDRPYGSAAAVAAALEACAVTRADAPVISRRVTRRRMWLAGVPLVAISAAIVAIEAWRSRAPAVLPLNVGDWIIVADFENATGDDALDMIAFAFKRDLEYSAHVRVAQASRIDDSLRLLRRPLESRLDAGLARQVALQDGGIRALVTGRIQKPGAAYLITVDLVNPVDGNAIGQLTEQAPTVSDITSAVRRATFALRARLGEPAESVTRSQQALQQTPPPSLTALRLYGQAAAKAHSISSVLPPTGVPYQGPEWAVVERLARGAVDADPRFARAWVLLSDAIGWGDRTRRTEMLAYVEKAFGFIDHATPRERYLIESRLHGSRAHQQRVRGNVADQRRELTLMKDATQALMALQPDDDEVNQTGLQRLDERLGPEFEGERALMTILAADARPRNVVLNLQVADIHLAQKRFDAARTYIARAERAAAAANEFEAGKIRLFGAFIAWLQDDVAEALRIADRAVRAAAGLSEAERLGIYQWVLPLYFALGRAGQAEGILNAMPADHPAIAGMARAIYLSNIGDKARLQLLVDTWPDSPSQLDLSVEKSENIALQWRTRYVIDAGRLDAAERYLSSLERVNRNQGSEAFKSIYYDNQGAFELARGRPAVAIDLLRRSLDIKTNGLPYLNSPPGQYTISLLARAFEAGGRADEAIALLRDAGDRRGAVPFDDWLLHRAHLARLYRKTGRQREARAVEAHLLKLLAVADPDFPLLKELRARSN